MVSIHPRLKRRWGSWYHELKDAISLYYLLKEEPTMRDAYRRIRDMLINPDTEKQAQRWESLLGILDNPTEDLRDRAIIRLEILFRKSLILQFLYKISLLQSNTMCTLAEKEPIKIEGRYILDIDSCDVECNIKDTILANRGVLEEILRRIVENHETYYTELSDIIRRLMENVDNMRDEYCKRLGDVIVAIDCPNEMELWTSDHHFDIICGAVGKSCYNPLTS